MKKILNGRLIGASFVVIAFLTTYFLADGVALKPFVFCCLLAALIEIAADLPQKDEFRKAGKGFRVAAICEILVFILAAISCFFLDYRMIATVMIAGAISDTGAFIFGCLFGKNNKVKALAKVSKNKSWVGFIAGAIIPFGLVILFVKLTMPELYESTTSFYRTIIIYAAISGIAAEIGDLLDSATKRLCGVKDSCEILLKKPFFSAIEWPIKTHGGYLDRFDSTAFGLCVFTAIYGIASLVC